MRYRYPFLTAEDAAWVADDCARHVDAAGGAVDVQGTCLFVDLPTTVPPAMVGRLALFQHDQVLDDSGREVEAAA